VPSPKTALDSSSKDILSSNNVYSATKSKCRAEISLAGAATLWQHPNRVLIPLKALQLIVKSVVRSLCPCRRGVMQGHPGTKLAACVGIKAHRMVSELL
jgi:hypothetical protein